MTLIYCAPLFTYKSIKPLAISLKSSLNPDDEIVTWYRYYQDLPIYLERRITIVADWHANNILQNDNWKREMWYNMPYQDTSEWLIEEPLFWERFSRDKRMVILIQDYKYANFLNHLQKYAKNTPVYQLPTINPKIIVVSNKPLESS
jgi:hypothetical protein